MYLAQGSYSKLRTKKKNDKIKWRREKGEGFQNAKIWSEENEMGRPLITDELLTRMGEKHGGYEKIRPKMSIYGNWSTRKVAVMEHGQQENIEVKEIMEIWFKFWVIVKGHHTNN